MTEIFNFLMIAGAVQGFLFNIVTFLSRKKIESPILFLNLFVLFLSLNNLQSWLIDKEFIAFNYYTLPFYVLLAPMFHAFLVHYLGIEKKRKTYFVHTAVIFLIELAARSFLIFRANNDPSRFGEIIETYNAIEDAITLSFSLFIFYKVLQIFLKYGPLYASILTFDDLKWIKRLIQLGALVLLFWGVAVLLNFVSETIKPPLSYYPLRLTTSIFIYWIGYQGFFRYVMLQDRIVLRSEIRKNVTLIDSEAVSLTENSQRTEKGESDFVSFDTYIKNNQKYLDPNLSMEKLTEELDTSVSSLSKLVNTYSGHNFPDYINRLRVEASKTYLADREFSSYTIVAIGLECGFNSKSTFYAAFRKFTGLTPTAYRSQHAA